MPSSVIEINGLVKKYGDRVAVQDVGFSVLEGEIFGLLEPNGAGKTTILSILATLLSPDEGQVTIAGHDLTREADQIKPLIGFVPQELALYSTLSAWDNLVFFGRIYGLRGPVLREHIEAVLTLVGLLDKLDYWKYSNQKQRWLASALLDIEPRLNRVKGTDTCRS